MTLQIILIIPLLASFLIALLLLPRWIKRAHHAGLEGKDMNKPYKIMVAEAGGVVVVAGFIIGVLSYIALKTFYFRQFTGTVELFVLISVILIVSFIGLIDDLLGWKIGLSKRVRLFLVLFAAIPLMVIDAGSSKITLPLLGTFNIGLLYSLIIIPLGVVGASTTFNFLAGYNGLEARQGILILGALAIVSYFTGSTWLAVALACMIAALLAFLIFNSYPARVFPGDTLTYALGALIATAAVLGNLERFAIFIFLPNILEILLKIRGRLHKESFAIPQKDGSLKAPYQKIYGLEHAAIFILSKIKSKIYEKDVVLAINFLQVLIIIIAFIIFREGIFLS